jgi:dCTP deaminase
MLMRDKDISEAVKAGTIGITPFDGEKLQGASYDLSLGGEALVSHSDVKIILEPNSSTLLHLEPGAFALVLTKELLKFPRDVVGVIGMRSALARKGLILLAGMQIDPGFEGHLRFGLYNASPRRITLDYDYELCMIEFHKLTGPVNKVIAPNPDLLRGRIPESDRDFLNSLETTSLSDLSKNMQVLTQNVSKLSSEVSTLFKFIVPVGLAILIAVIIGALKLMFFAK